MAWIIGDVHGCIKTLEALLKKLPKGEKVIFTGDLIDRGPGSKEVVALVRSLGHDCVKGNHEEVMVKDIVKILKDNSYIDKSFWTQYNGGMETLGSYNSAAKKELISDIRWINRLPVYLEYPDIVNKEGRCLVVSHASAALYWDKKDFPKKSIEYKDFIKGALCSRDQSPKDIPGVYNIFGHTPVKNPLIQKHFANVDTGACYMERNLGSLTAIEFPSLKTIQQKNLDMKR
jgi:serine/threonine protein phosphatase 1